MGNSTANLNPLLPGMSYAQFVKSHPELNGSTPDELWAAYQLYLESLADCYVEPT